MTGARIRWTEIVAGLPATVPFVGPEAIERRTGRGFALRLGANESLFGSAPGVATAIEHEIARAGWYGDPEAFDVRQKLAMLHGGLPLEAIVMGAGIDELLGVFVRLVTAPGEPVVTSAGAYPTFNYHVAGVGGRLVAVPYRDDAEDLGALAEAVRAENAKLVYVANPDNPMGSWHDAASLTGFIKELPDDVLVLLDEAYAEFAPTDAIPGVSVDDPRLVRLRTFSKAHGLAGLRIGYVIGHPDVIAAAGKIRNHFGVNRLAQAAAIASLDDPDFVGSVVAEVAKGRAELALIAASRGCRALPSATNFVTIDVGGAERARAILAALEEAGVFIRMPGVAPLNRCIRVTVGPPDQRARFAACFAAVTRRL